MSEARNFQQTHTWKDEAEDLMRGIGGAAIIGVPLIYTMEMWQLATVLSPTRILILAGASLVLNIGYNYISGFRKDSGLLSAIRDSIESYAIGAVFSLVLLWLLHLVDGTTPLVDIASKVALEAIPLSLGVSVANTQFGGGSRAGSDNGGGDNGDDSNGSGKKMSPRLSPTLLDIGVTVAGSVIFSFNVAPTEEVMRLATDAPWYLLVGVVLFSLFLSCGMIFVAEFGGLSQTPQKGLLQQPLGETVLCYVISLTISALLIGIFHPITPAHSLFTFAAATVVLGLPATIGGAAGRLVS